MTPENAKALLPIITAFAEGKTVQYRFDGSWTEVANADFSNAPENYRIKPEIMRVRVMIAKNDCNNKKVTRFLEIHEHGSNFGGWLSDIIEIPLYSEPRKE
jgi:hypothetical protein